ncbi:hypothetical protein DUNSADRAFT_13031 [Dunaliella salina]|uniref:Uncharacterized protein n=1 Tax=Dunaliella salina TaxID=3046 RepID=A0ABQ7GA60_DUNSA|nr:hypothetical protein DUNSADRAFT_13031 [Dunaliella salina]|eukprot:KAF5831500.1 hypothetical protein DUNSADRAFT_13031 [Dunaliella salina]
MHAHAWDQEAEYRCSNSEQNSIVVPSIALIYPSCLPPSGVKRVRTEQHQHQQQVKACAAGIQEPIPSGQLVEQQLMLQGQGSGHHHHHQQQQQQQQHMQLNFKAYVTAPSAFWLSGWHGNEEGHIQEGADGGDELQLLAHSYGRYLPVDIVQQGTRDETGAQRVQVCVSLPPHMKAFDCCQLRLEVVRGSSLLCNCNTMLVSSALAPVLLELEAWAKSKRAVQDHVSLFVDDLAEWLSFQSLVHTTCTDSARTAQGLCGQGSTMAIINNNSSSVSSGSSLDSSARAVQGLCGQGSNRPACSEEGTRCKGMGATQGGRNAVLGGNGGTSGGKQPATADVMGSKRPVCDEEGAYSAGVGPRDSLYGSTQDGTHGGTPGSTHCSTHGNTHGSQGSTHCSTHGNTHGNTGGSTQDSTCGSTHSETHGGPCSHVDSKTHGSRRPSAPSFLAALAEEALRPEVLQMMAQVGMDLLQHAVSWGMVHLAERILSGLLAPPLSVPFTTIAASDSSTSDTGVEPSDSHPPQAPRGHPKGSDVGVEPADSWSPPLGGSLLERALRCGNVHMLACVLEWGRMHGGLEVAWVPSPHHPIEDCHAENQPASRQLLPDNSTCAFNVPAVGTPAVGTPSTPHHPTEDCHEENEAQVGQPVPGASGASSSSLQPASRQLPPDNGACAFNAPAVDTPSPAVSTTAQPQCTLQASPFSACNVGSTNASLASPFSACNVCSTSTSLASPFSAGNASDSSKLKPSPGVGTGAAVSGAPCHPSPFSAANVCAVVSSTNPDQPPGVCASAAATGNPSVSAPACEAGPSTAAAAAAGAMPGSNWTSTSMLRVLWYGFDGRDGIHEDEYRQWCLANSAGLANKCCMGVVPFFWAGAVQSTRKGLFKSAITMGLYPIPMLLALLTKSPKKRERYMFLAKVTHYTLYIIFGLGLLPTIVARKLAVTHLDLIVEVVVLYRLCTDT